MICPLVRSTRIGRAAYEIILYTQVNFRQFSESLFISSPKQESKLRARVSSALFDVSVALRAALLGQSFRSALRNLAAKPDKGTGSAETDGAVIYRGMRVKSRLPNRKRLTSITSPSTT